MEAFVPRLDLRLTAFIILLFIVSFTSSWSQTIGPAGVGTGDGSTGPRNVLWLRGDAGIVQSGGLVTDWLDQSGNALNAAQSVAAERPSFTASNINLNGFPSINFSPDGSNAIRLVVPDNDLLDDGPGFTFFMALYNNSTDGGPSGILNKRNGNNNQQSYRIYRAGSTFISNVGNSSNTVNLGGMNVGSHLLTARYDGTLPGNKYFAFRNSNLASGSSNGNNLTSLPNTTSNLHIGNFNPGDTRSFIGDIAEVIIYKDALNNAQKLIVENYLSQKYTINIGINDLFGNSAGYNDVFFQDFRGIGSDDGTIKETVATSDALRITEFGSSIGVNEYLMFAHDGTAHADGVTADLGEPEITSRWDRSWYLEFTQGGVVDGGALSATLSFNFSTAGLPITGNPGDYVLLYRDDISGDFFRVFAQSYVIEGGDRLEVTVPGDRLKTGYYTIGLGSQLTSFTWYVFQDGNWTDPDTWTLDASAAPIYNNPGNNIPQPSDQVIIRSGRSVTIQPGTDNLEVNAIEVRGNLNLTTSTGHNFNTINGNGIIRMNGHNPGSGLVDNFPAGNTMGNIGFSDPANGGTLVINGTGALLLNQDRTFRNLRINRQNAADVVSLGADWIINGDLNVRNGDFRFGDATATTRSLTVQGDVLVENNNADRVGRISTANVAGAFHNFQMEGDFTNNGKAFFTNRADFASVADRYNPSNTYYTNDDNTGRVEVTFSADTRNQAANLNDETFFSRLIIDKGSDETYELVLLAADSAYFRLLGRANYNVNNDPSSPADNLNAFALISGTVRLSTNVHVPVLNRNTNYSISSTSRLWVDGGLVRKSFGTAIVPYGAVEVSNGRLIADVGSGVTLRQTGSLKVDGGEVQMRSFRTSVQGSTAQGTYEQNGGTVLVSGGGGLSGAYAVFSLTYTGNVFIMTGGTLRIQGRPNLGSGGTRGTVFINADPGNQNVTGGRVIFESNTTTEYRVTSRAPFYNLDMQAANGTAANIVLIGTTSGTGGGEGTQTLDAQPLRVLNDLIIRGHNDNFYNNPLGSFPIVFAPVTSDTNVNDVFVGGSMFVGRNSTYLPLFGGTAPYNNLANQPTHKNTTYFNQTIGTSAIDTLYWGVTGSGVNQLEMGGMVLDRNSGNELRTIARNGNNGAIRFDINGDASVLSGTLDQNAYTYRIWGSITNFDRFGTYFPDGTYPVAGGTPEVAQIRFREDPPLVFTTSDDAVFGNIRFNVGAGSTVEFTTDVYIERLEYWNGRIYIGSNTLTVDDIWNWNNGGGAFFDNDIANNSLLRVNNTGEVANISVFTDGNSSDGGLRIKVNANTLNETLDSRLNNEGPITFPVGFTTDGGTTRYYRPAQVKIKDFADEGYIRVRAVSGEIPTSNLGGGEILRHYWRVTHDGFDNLPTAAFRFYYRNRTDGNVVDLQVGNANQATYVPGYVLDGSPFTRFFESDPDEDLNDLQDGPNANTRFIVFNGPDTNAEFDQNDFTGFTLFNGNFSAGESSRFTGSINIYYSRIESFGWYNRFWEDGNNWSEIPHDGAGNNAARPAAGTWPQTGDVAVIGYGGYGAGTGQHSITIENGNNIEVAEIIYDNPNNNSSRVVVNRNATLTFGKIGGSGGTFMVRPSNPTDNAVINGDFGEFYTQNSFTFAYFLNGNGTYNITPPTTIFPNLRVEGGNNSRIAVFQDDIMVNNNFTVDGNTRVRTNNGPNGDITVLQQLRIGGWQGGNFEFNDGQERTVEVGDINLRQTGGGASNSNLVVINTNPNGLRHRLIVNGDLIRTNSGNFNLFNGLDPSDNNSILEFRGSGQNDFTQTDGSTASFYQIVMNKGNDTTSTFTLPVAFNIPDADGAFQPLEILNGLLIIDTENINGATGFTMANNQNFLLPNTIDPQSQSGSGGLEIRQGTLRVRGANTGIILDGLLRISGGTLDMDGGAGVNNFIEYGSSGNAVLEISDGNLTVGSQLRRTLTSTSGVLKYRQTGGMAVFGKNAVPSASRGVFEVMNSGSEFTYTDGSFTIVRHTNSTTVPTLRLSPSAHEISRAILMGNADTPANQNNMGVLSNIVIDSLLVNSSNATVKIYSLPLEVNTLGINTGANFNANGLNLTVNSLLSNEGTFITSGNTGNNQTTFFPSGAASAISGTGSTNFWNFEKDNGGTLSVNKNIIVDNNATVFAGTLATGTSAFNIRRDLVFDAIHTSASGGQGIVFNGSQKQKIGRTSPGTSTLSAMRLNNNAGLINENLDQTFIYTNKLVMVNGVFDIGGNLISFTPEAVIENGSGGTAISDFNITRMIQTNSAINDFGIRKQFNAIAAGNETFTFPVGLLSYTPVRATVNDISASSITIRPVNDIPPVPVTYDFPDGCSDPVIDGTENVLQYYWIVNGAGVSGFSGMLEMFYNPDDVSVTAPYTVANYGPARLYNADDQWDKVFTEDQFDEANQRIEFPFTGNTDPTISGIYTAGVTLENDGTTLLCGGAIPDQVPLFETHEISATGEFYVDGSYDGGEAPLVGSTPDIVVKSGFTLVMNVNSIRTRKITIEAGATLEVGAGTVGHNLGFVTGEGTLKLVSNTSSLSFPSGDYQEFFPDTNCNGGGGLEYAGTGTYNVLNGLPRVRNVIFSGSGTRTLPNNGNLLVCQNLEILGTVSLIVPDGNNQTFVRQNIFKSDAGAFDNGGGSSRITLEGNSLQLISGDFTGTSSFNRLRVNNPAGATIVNVADGARGITANRGVDVSSSLILSNGLITTNDNNPLRLRLGAGTTGATVARYVNGPLVRTLSPGSQTYPYPVGNTGRFGQLSLINPGGYAGQKDFKVAYFNQDPNLAPFPGPYNTALITPPLLSVSENEYWIAGAPSPANAVIRIRYDINSNVPAEQDDRDEMLLAFWDGAIWDIATPNATITGDANNGNLTTIGSLSFSDQVITHGFTTPIVPLPITLQSFTGRVVFDENHLFWTTATEIDNDFFEIQRSTNGETFEVIGILDGAGNSNVPISYKFIDNMPGFGQNLYRLRQIDFDGSFSYSPVIMLNNQNVDKSVRVEVFPNPAKTNKEVTVRIWPKVDSAPVQIEIYDTFGRNIYTGEASSFGGSSTDLILDSGLHLRKGMYIINVKQGFFNAQRKLIIIE